MPPRPVIPLIPAADEALRPTRRDLVKWLGASMALAAGGCSRLPQDRIYSYARMPEIEADGLPLYYASACLRAGYAQGVLVGTQQGRPVKVEGNADHPASLGGTSVFSQAAVLQLWDPDRSTAVWQRDETAHAAPSTWQAFVNAWHARVGKAGGGTAPVHVLATPFTSPTLAAQLAALLALNPGSRWYRDDAAPALAAARGAEFAFGQPARVVHRLDQAELIVAIGGDPFSDPVAGVRQSADWARARAAALAAGRAPARLVALETTPGLFGARADERWALAPPAIEAVVACVCGALVPGTSAPAADPALTPVVARLVALLEAHRGRAIVVGGEVLSAESHAAVHALNQALGADGSCRTVIDAPDRHADVLPAPGTLAELVALARGGQVGTLLVLGANPFYAAPAALDVDAAFSKVPFSVHHGGWRDETGTRCTWHLPCGHDFEQWSDARAFEGTVSLMQPAIAPLYDTRSAHELLAMLMPPGRGEQGARAPVGGHDLLRAYWRNAWKFPEASVEFDARWTDSLRLGVVAGSALPALKRGTLRLPVSWPSHEAAAGSLWAVFPLDPSVGDGDHANNGWLQELPRPFSKIAWGNALQLGPRTALARGLASGDRVRVEVDGRALELPVWVDARHAEGAGSLTCGGGRRAAGRVGDGVGVDNAALRSPSQVAVALRMERIGGGHRFALAQVEHDQHERELGREVSLEQAKPGQHAEGKAIPSLYPPAAPIAPVGPAWAMAIDLDACIGCNVCTVACQSENNIAVVGPDEVRVGRAMHWIRVDAWEGEADKVITQPVPCMHCENAPCELVCPVGATVHDSEGLNVQVYNRCIGTRFCSNNCPYKVRRFNFRQYSDIKTETARLLHNPDVTVRDRGVMEKCSYCVQRLSRARRAVQKSGEALPSDTVVTACQAACPTGAIHFGDLNDPRSDVVRTKASPRHYAMLEALGTRPRTTYLARVAALAKESS